MDSAVLECLRPGSKRGIGAEAPQGVVPGVDRRRHPDNTPTTMSAALSADGTSVEGLDALAIDESPSVCRWPVPQSTLLVRQHACAPSRALCRHRCATRSPFPPIRRTSAMTHAVERRAKGGRDDERSAA